MNHILMKFIHIIIWSGIITSVASGSSWGTELYIPALKAKAGESVEIPVMIDQTDNLAGIKLVMKYDADVLTFKKADKTKYTASLMHIVNDKNPGVLVVVMAGARGVKGENFPILSLKFDLKADVKDKKTAHMEMKELQLMSDQLKNIQCSTKITPLVILANLSETEPDGKEKPECIQTAVKADKTPESEKETKKKG